MDQIPPLHSTQSSQNFDFDFRDIEQEIDPTNVQVEQDVAGSSSTTIQSRKQRSQVWEMFDKDLSRNKAICKVCKKEYAWKKGDGMGTLKRHMPSHPNFMARLDRQQQISTQGGELKGNFYYNHDVALDAISKWVCVANQPLGEPETEEFVEMVQTGLQPGYKRMPRTTIKTRQLKNFGSMKEALIACFDSSSFQFALTCDSWKAVTQLHFLCVTCHWIDDDWVMQKRIIAFRPFEHPHSASNIAKIVTEVTREYRIINKIFCISFDNARSNDAAIPHLKVNMTPILGGELFHNRCACHVLNLCVQDGFKQINDIVDTIRGIVLFIHSSTVRLQHWKALCREQGLNYKKFRPDCETRWNSTFDMFQSVLPFKAPLIEFCNNNNFSTFLDNATFDSAFVVSSFLETFKNATELLSGSYYPTTHLVIPTLTRVAYVFDQYREHVQYGTMMDAMSKKKFKIL